MNWLYKKSKKGDKIQKWGVEIEGNKFRSHEGFTDGVISVGEWTTCEGKNLNKKNETSPDQQALLEVASRYQKKKDKGYTEDAENCERLFEPTLAKVWEDYKDEVEYPVLVECKFDGIRCVYKKETGKLYTRNGKEIVSCPHLVSEIQNHPFLNNLELVDGELYNHDFKEDFNSIVSLVKRTKVTEEDLRESARLIQFHIYDCSSKEPYQERMSLLKNKYNDKGRCIKIVNYIFARSENDVKEFHDEFVAQGYEGAMVRWGDGKGYVEGRTKFLLKVKVFTTEEFELLEILNGRGKKESTVGKYVIRLEGEKTNEVSPTGTDEFNKEIFLNKEKYIGKKMTVKYFGRTPAPENKLRFPTFVAFRDYE